MIEKLLQSFSWRASFEVVTTLVMVSLAGLLVWQNRSGGISTRPGTPSAVIQAPSRPISISGSPTRGSLSARVAVIEYTDFECPFCAQAANGPLRQFMEEYVDSGRVLFVLKNLPLPMHKMAPRAAAIALCAGEQGKYWEMHDALFRQNGKLDEADLGGLPRQVGLRLPTYAACIDSERAAAAVKADTTEAAELSVKSTPTFVFGVLQTGGQVRATDVLRGAQPIEQLRAVLDKRLREAVERR